MDSGSGGFDGVIIDDNRVESWQENVSQSEKLFSRSCSYLIRDRVGQSISNFIVNDSRMAFNPPENHSELFDFNKG